MIRLDVKEYCHGCYDFDPDVEKPTRLLSANNEIAMTDTVVRCEHRRRCERIKRYLDRCIEKEGEEQ